ncbi:protein Rf1, mitochondrial-like isoform X3 [Miscanthus floridulus]
MPEVGCTPSVVSYNTLLKGFCDEKRAEEALELLHMMSDGQGSSCPPDVVSYTTVIKGFFSEGQVDKACSLFVEMGVSPNVVTYNTIIDGLCKAQSVDRAKGVFQQMIDKGVKPDNETYNCLIHGYLSTAMLAEKGEPKRRKKSIEPSCESSIVPVEVGPKTMQFPSSQDASVSLGSGNSLR